MESDIIRRASYCPRYEPVLYGRILFGTLAWCLGFLPCHYLFQNSQVLIDRIWCIREFEGTEPRTKQFTEESPRTGRMFFPVIKPRQWDSPRVGLRIRGCNSRATVWKHAILITKEQLHSTTQQCPLLRDSGCNDYADSCGVSYLDKGRTERNIGIQVAANELPSSHNLVIWIHLCVRSGISL